MEKDMEAMGLAEAVKRLFKKRYGGSEYRRRKTEDGGWVSDNWLLSSGFGMSREP
jgi:hypothetical protein